MKTLRNVLLIVVAAGIGLLVGFVMRAKPARLPQQAESSTNTLADDSLAVGQGNKKGRVKRHAGNRVHDDSPLATGLERDLSMSSGVTKWLYWLEAIEIAVPTDFPRLASMAKGNPAITRLIATRWIDLDPRHLFDTLASSAEKGRDFPSEELAQVLFKEWPKRDPDAVVASLNEPGKSGARNLWRINVINSFFEDDVERGIRLLSQWKIESYGPNMKAVAKWAASNPQHAAEYTLAHPAGYGSSVTMETVGREWARTDPVRALEFAAGIRGKLGSTLANSVVTEWSGRNLTEAAAWLTGTDAKTRNRLSSGFVEAWAKQDVDGALAWCESNLSGSTLNRAVGGVLKGVAEKDAAGAAGLVAQMAPSAARAEAALAVAEKWFPGYDLKAGVLPQITEWLAGLDRESLRRVLDQLSGRWIREDPNGFAAFIANRSSDQVPPYAYSNLARNLARTDPAEALDWASRLPEAQGLSAGSEAFSEWRRSQPESAMQWLTNLSPSDSRRQPFLESAIRDLADSPTAAEQLKGMIGLEPDAARKVIGNMKLTEDRRNRLLQALETP